MLAAALLPNRQLLLIAWPNWWADEEHLVWLEPSGQIARRQTVRRKTRYEPPSLTWVGWQMAIAAPLPIANIGYTTIAAPQGLLAEKSELTYPQALATVLRSTWLSVLTVLALGAISAVFAYRRQRRFGLSHGPAWAIFVFLFGLPGYLAYRFHRPWPVLEECPACHQPAPRDRQACLDCGAPFPPPPQKGIEVFA
jgi:hypothetical protein